MNIKISLKNTFIIILILENLITNKTNRDENLYKIKKDIKKNNEFNKAQFV